MQYRQTPAERELQEFRMELRRRKREAREAAKPKSRRAAWVLYCTGLSAAYYCLYTMF
jgi:hypothetical protein